ncbi:LPP20 family lipoprotein [Thiosulfativibrio zosterae]|uniref:Lipoprotein LPP20-like domain-containing protein n=1 Tax=Thiosulfativibrio zosterae TaxID=2675053 RepID=A0A6F8PPR8_9GAMM|nr:LPP20 family lipoprotein [Thiosulfativibrio zosterae]BBP43990.1 hypothetical protein THMIRHAT_17360 [Thiosulfativibrio zosterae]
MKKQMILMVTGLASAIVLSGCMFNSDKSAQDDASKQVIYQEVHQNVANSAPQPTMAQPAPEPMQTMPQRVVEPELIKITGIGYGAESTYEAYTPGQRRLMAIRSSKLDAYRALAEQLYGIKVDSNTAVSTLTAKNDSFRARVNAMVRGARVVSITPMADNNYETVLEVYIDQSFFRNTFVYSSCTDGSCYKEPVDAAELCGQGMKCRSLGGY